VPAGVNSAGVKFAEAGVVSEQWFIRSSLCSCVCSCSCHRTVGSWSAPSSAAAASGLMNMAECFRFGYRKERKSRTSAVLKIVAPCLLYPSSFVAVIYLDQILTVVVRM